MINHRLGYRTQANDIPPLGERRYEPRLATKAGLEFIMGEIAKLPTRRGMHFAVGVAAGAIVPFTAILLLLILKIGKECML